MTEFEKKYLMLAKEIVLKHISINDDVVFLFGSRAQNVSGKFSDIDIGIWNEKQPGNCKTGNLLDEIEQSAVPYDVELVDFTIVNDKFRKEALKNIEVWNLPKSLETKFSSFVKRSLG